MATKKKLLEAAAGAAGGAALNVEDVFSTYLYDGNQTARTITNGIDLAGEGGLTWITPRTVAAEMQFIDSERGVSPTATPVLISSLTNGQINRSGAVTAYNSDGFDLGTYDATNYTGRKMVSWTFRKAPKFFDVVKYQGNNESAQYVNHNLGVTPGCIILKALDGAGKWYVWHRGLSSASHSLRLNTTAAESVDTNYEIGINASDTQFYVDTGSEINSSTNNYIAYLFAHNNGDGEFGPTGDQDIIKCGSFTTNSSSTASVNLGWEPQWVIIKPSSGAGQWFIIDSMRGLIVDDNDKILKSDATSAESNGQALDPTPTGFNVLGGGIYASTTYIYIAIRKGPMAVPESATDVFGIDTLGSGPPGFQLGNPVDMALRKIVNSTADWQNAARLTNGKFLKTNSTSTETTSNEYVFDYQDGWNSSSATDTNTYSWMWRRAPSFFDVVAYTGTGATQTINHNLGVKPEAILIKQRSGATGWIWWYDAFGDNQTFIRGDLANATFTNTTYFNNTAPTDTQITLGFHNNVSGSTSTNYIAYLFATLPGISKVGSYTGNGGPSQDIDCGFSNGARFVLVKAASGAGDWWMWDTTRGITSGNDASIKLNSTAAQVTTLDFINPLSSGFTVVGSDSSRNGSGITYIYYAIA